MMEEFPTGRMGSQDGERGARITFIDFRHGSARPFGRGTVQPDPYGTKINDGY